jgi:uncharacterized protein with HEPN domain
MSEPRSPRLLLADMLDSCRFIEVAAVGRSLENFEQDRMFRGAMERELMIIGEALYQLNREQPDIASLIPEHLKIISFRHVLVQAYAILDR